MSFTQKILLVVFALETMVVASCTYYLSLPTRMSHKALLPPIIRLYGPTGFFTCSGTVISKTIIVTAAHCLGGPGGFTPILEVRAADEKPRGILGLVAGANPNSDLAVIRGNFQDFENKRLIINTNEIIRIFQSPTKHLITCGYPHGGDLTCVPLLNPKQYLFQFTGSGFLYPGMSGGPVIDTDTGSIIAVNTAVMENEHLDATLVLVSPTIEIFHDTETTGLLQ